MTDEFELDLRLAALNQKLLRKLWWCWVVAIALFFLSLLFNDFAFAIATWTAEYIPSIEKLLQPGMALEKLAGKYFGVLVCFLPIFVLAIVWREDIRIRFLSTAKKPGKSILKNFIGVYFLFIPLVIFFLAVFYAAPFDMPTVPRLAGQHVLHFMIATYPGLLLFGSALGMSIAIFTALLIGYLWLPFSMAIHYFLNEKKMDNNAVSQKKYVDTFTKVSSQAATSVQTAPRLPNERSKTNSRLRSTARCSNWRYTPPAV